MNRTSNILAPWQRAHGLGDDEARELLGLTPMALSCQIPRLEAAHALEPSSTLCPCGHDLVFAPGWFCDDCAACVFPDLVRDCDDEPEPEALSCG